MLNFRAMVECRYSLRLVLFPSMVSLDYQMESKQSELYHFVLEKTGDPLDCGMDDIQPFESSLKSTQHRVVKNVAVSIIGNFELSWLVTGFILQMSRIL